MNGEPQTTDTPQQIDLIALFITWTTYGTWLPGDSRGWRKWQSGEQRPQPSLENWCRKRLKEAPVLLSRDHRAAVERVIRDHCQIRGWNLHAVAARSNHVQLAVTTSTSPKRVRDQLKANATRVLRRVPNPIMHEKVWTKGGDIQFIDTDEDLNRVVIYITVAQDRMN